MHRCPTPDLPAVTPVLSAVSENGFLTWHRNSSEQDPLCGFRSASNFGLKVPRQAISLAKVVKRGGARAGESLPRFAHEENFAFRQKPISFAVPFGSEVEIPRQI